MDLRGRGKVMLRESNKEIWRPRGEDIRSKMKWDVGILYCRVQRKNIGFRSLCQDYILPKSHYFRHLLVHSFAAKYFSDHLNSPPGDLMCSFLNVISFNMAAVSKLYNSKQDPLHMELNLPGKWIMEKLFQGRFWKTLFHVSSLFSVFNMV